MLIDTPTLGAGRSTISDLIVHITIVKTCKLSPIPVNSRRGIENDKVMEFFEFYQLSKFWIYVFLEMCHVHSGFCSKY